MRRRVGRIVRFAGGGVLLAALVVLAYRSADLGAAVLAIGVGVAMIGHWMTGFGRPW